MNTFLTPCILQSITICCTIILAMTIVASAYRVHKGEQRSLGAYIYHASILCVLSVSIFSYFLKENRNVLDFVSLASSLISIILAIITIIYSFYSNSQSSSQIDALNKAAESVKQATASYSDSANNLQENISKIIIAVNRVEEKTNKLLESTGFQNLAKKTEKLSSQMDIKAYIKGYINSASPLGIIAMYACIKSSDNEKDWYLNSFFDTSNQLYCGGFLISTSSTGIISLNINFDDGRVHITDYAPPVKELILNSIQNNPNVQSKQLKEIKEHIDKYFS